jgi:hypothetical protein
MCVWVGNQRSRGIVTARVQTDAVQSLHHQHRDLHQSTYAVPLGRSRLILLSQPSTRYVRSCRIYLVKVLDMSAPPRNFLLNFVS